MRARATARGSTLGAPRPSGERRRARPSLLRDNEGYLQSGLGGDQSREGRRSAGGERQTRLGKAGRKELQRLAERTGLLTGRSLIAACLLRGSAAVAMAIKLRGSLGPVPGMRVCIGRCPGLRLLGRVPIRHRGIHKKDEGGQQADGVSCVQPWAQQIGSAKRAAPSNLPVPLFVHYSPDQSKASGNLSCGIVQQIPTQQKFARAAPRYTQLPQAGPRIMDARGRGVERQGPGG